ncbi:MAG: pyridoxal phosphate biosynthetic protein [Erythrobacter sp.]
MTDDQLPTLSRDQKLWSFGAAALFLIAVAFLGFALNAGVMRGFAIGWLALQIFGYVGALKIAKGDFSHPLFKSQVILHSIALMLLVVSVTKATS